MSEIGGKVVLLRSFVFLTIFLAAAVKGLPLKKQRSHGPTETDYQLVEEIATSSDVASFSGEELPHSNRMWSLRQNGQLIPHRQTQNWPLQHTSGKQLAVLQSAGTLPEESTPFVLDLQSLLGLANVDLNAQNPHIQVTIEVVDDPQAEIEMDLLKGSSNDWSLSSSDWLSPKDLFWPLFWEYTDPVEKGGDNLDIKSRGEEEEEDTSEYDDEEEIVLSGIGENWDQRWPGQNNWIFKQNYNYDYEDEEEWDPWSPCSVSCGSGNQKRSRSCGYACTATESRTCELQPCPRAGEELVSAMEETSPEAENTTEILNADVDSCEKWLNCKSDFLGKYLSTVLSDLPSCPCSYPLEAAYSAVNLRDEEKGKSFRWQDASGPKERLDIYKSTAHFCLRSMLSFESTTLGAQHCCYDENANLITRGKGAGAPNLISTEFSPELHYKVDMLPWILCKGDWSRYHTVRPPNNGQQCAINPPDEEYLSQLQEAREY